MPKTPDISFTDKKCGQIRVRLNEEYETKTTLIATGPHAAHAELPATALWRAWQVECIQGKGKAYRPVIKRAGGAMLESPPAIEMKPYRKRHFYTFAAGHPPAFEMRMEDLTTMIKLAKPQKAGSSVLHRTEIRIKQTLPGKLPLVDLPPKITKMLPDLLLGGQGAFIGVMSESFREKMTLATPFTYDGVDYVIMCENAFDIGVVRSIAGHERNITEFENEVKAIYLATDYVRGDKVDLKTEPKRAGLKNKHLSEIIEVFLQARLDVFLRFGNKWLKQNDYTDCALQNMQHSKSQPEMQALHQVLTHGGARAQKALKKALKCTHFALSEPLNDIRVQI